MYRTLFLTAALLALTPLAAYPDVRLTWEPGAGDPPLGYIITRRLGAGGYEELWRLPAAPYLDSTAPPRLTVCWQVFAYNERGVSEGSNQLCLSLPQAPVNLSITTSGPTVGQARVSVQTRVRKRK